MNGESSSLYPSSVALGSLSSGIGVLSYVPFTNENLAASSLTLEDHLPTHFD